MEGGLVMAKPKCLILMIALSSMFTACASKAVRTGRIPQEGLTVSQIYHQVIDENEENILPQKKLHLKARAHSVSHYEGAFHQAFMNVSQEFKPLQNPTIPIYITPKVVLVGDEQIIKPGFVTQFYLFKQNQFALNTERY